MTFTVSGSKLNLRYMAKSMFKTDGNMFSWGRNNNGQLGQSNTTNRSSPTQVGTLSNWSVVSCGQVFAIAVKTDGTLWAWGQGELGQLGSNTSTNVFSPIQIGALSNWSRVSCGLGHTIAVKTDGTLWGWGQNSFGQLGLSDITLRSSPVQVGTMSDWKTISTDSYYHTSGVKSDGSLWTWGNNSYGQLGLGNV